MMSLMQAAQFAQGALSGADAQVLRVISNSRQAQPGDLFIALKGERFDAHDFVAEVCSKGAFALVEQGFDLPGASLIKVEDTRLALGRLAAGWCAKLDPLRLAITGSSGKTTVKEMLATILRTHAGEDAVLATMGNLNNDIGLPLTLLQLRPTHRYAVLEMGMNHHGELRYLTRLAKPNVALVNNVMRAHFAYFGSVEQVARAKAEIFEGLDHKGVALINITGGCYLSLRKAARDHQQSSFGLAARADISASSMVLGALDSRFVLTCKQGRQEIHLPVPGKHNVSNALAAAALALAVDVPLDTIARGLAAFQGSKGRLQQQHSPRGFMVLDDSYNANPDSMKAALDVLVRLPEPHYFVMGDIGELGDEAPAFHAEVGSYAKSCGITQLLALGELSAQAAQAYGSNAQHFASIEALYAYLDHALPAGASVLVKGSRFMRMERVVAHLMQPIGKE